MAAKQTLSRSLEFLVVRNRVGEAYYTPENRMTVYDTSFCVLITVGIRSEFKNRPSEKITSLFIQAIYGRYS